MAEDFRPDDDESPSIELVHWMGRGPLRLGPSDVPAAVLAAFALGALAAIGAMTALGWFVRGHAPHPPRGGGRRQLH